MADFLLTVGLTPDVSYTEMQKQITALYNDLNKNPLKIKVQFDKSSLDAMRNQIAEIQKSLVSSGGSNSASGGFTKLASEATKAAGAVQNASKAIKSASDAASTKAANEAAAQSFKDATRAVKEYYAMLTTLSKTKGHDISLTGEGYKSASGNYNELAAALNRTKTAYDLVTDSMNAMPAEQQVQIQALMAQQAREYALTLEQQANKERDAAQAAADKAAKEAEAAASTKAANEAAAQAKAQAKEEAAAKKEAANAAKEKAAADRDAEKAVKEANAVIKTYSTSIIQGEAALRNWSAAERSKNKSSREAYSNLKSSVEAMRDAKAAYDSGTGSIDNLREKTNAYKSTLKDTEQVLKANGDATKALGDRLTNLATKFGSWLTVSQVIMYAVRSVRKMITTSIELDDAMTQLRIVTNETDAAYEKFGNNIAKTAQKIGASISDLVDSTTTYARLGYNLDEASQLAEFTSMLQNVGDIDVSAAQDAITSIVKAYDVNISDIESIMDKLVAVGNNAPISVAQIAEGMTNASSALHAAGNTFEQSVALLTAANTTIQDAAKSSTGLRTIAARIRNTKTELDDLGEVMTEAQYENLVKTLTDYNVALTDMNGEYRSTYDILKDVAAEWGNMTSMEQAALTTALSGTRQQAVFYSIIEQFQEASGAMDTMANSAGTLQSSYDEFMQSTTAHINTFKAAFQQLSADFFKSDFLNSVVDIGTNLLNILDTVVRLTNYIGGLKTALSAIAGVALIRNANSIWNSVKNIGGSISLVVQDIQLFGQGFSEAFSTSRAQGVGRLKSSISGLSGGFDVLTTSVTTAQITMAAFVAVIAAVSIAVNKIQEAEARLRKTQEDAFNSSIDRARESENLYNAYAAYLDTKRAVDDNTASKEALDAATRSLAEALGLEGDAAGKTREEIEALTLQELEKAKYDAADAVINAEKKLSGLMHTFKDSKEKEMIHGRSDYLNPDFSWDLASEAEQAAELIRVYEGLIQERNAMIDSRETDSVAFDNIEAAIDFLKSDVNDLITARDTLNAVEGRYTSIVDGTATAVENATQATEELKAETNALKGSAEDVGNTLKKLWSSEDFESSKDSLVKMAKTLDGITPKNIEDLADSSEELAGLLELDGVNAKFLAHVLQTEIETGHGFDLITDSALTLNQALEGMIRNFDDVSAAKERYDAALAVPEKDTDFRSMADAFKALNEQFEAGTVNSNKFWAAAEFIFGKDALENWGWADGLDEIYAAMQKNAEVFGDADTAGAHFLDRLNEIATNGEVLGKDGSVIATVEKFADGSFDFNVDALHLDELAEKMGISKEAVVSCLEALSMWGDVDYYNIQEVLDAINEIGLSSDKFDGVAVNVALLKDQLVALGYTSKDIHDILTDLKAVDGVTLLDITASVDTLVGSLQNLGVASSENGSIYINVEGLAELASDIGLTYDEASNLISRLSDANNITLTNANGEVTDLDGALEALDGKTFASVEGQFDDLANSASNAADRVNDVGTAIRRLPNGKVITITVNEVYNTPKTKFHHATGTKHAPGGDSLVGEDGAELVVHDNEAYLVGTHGAEITNLSPGDQVYTASQTKRILGSAYGIHGTIPAYSGGTPGSASGHISFNKYDPVISSSSNTSSKNNNKDDDHEVIDWIEIATNRIERAINRLSNIASSAFKSIKTKLSATDSEIEAMISERNLQSQGAQRYLAEANSIGLSESLSSKVRDGTIDISQYDKDTADLIKQYQKWYEKMLDCAEAADKLSESIASLYQQKFDDIQKDYDNQLALFEHMTNTYDTGIEMIEERGYLASTKLYSAMSDVERQNILIKQQQLGAMIQAFSDAMNSGEIEKGSDAWYEFQKNINAVKESIQESELNLIKFNNAMRDVEWERFDYLQERIGNVAEEADFLIDLIDNSKLFDDNGEFNDNGMAVMGLHGQNYNVYMNQADRYADEIMSLNAQIAKDPNNKTLLDRREELLKLQRDSILAAEDEKQAMVDLVKEGIDIELDALQKLIDSYTDAMDAAKNLHDYQKKVKSQTEGIAKLQKQLAAYRGDNSEESRATIQRLEVSLNDAMESLNETQYEHYISEQKKLLDDLYDDYETVLNKRLDDIDGLIVEMIGTINTNSGSIATTIGTACDNVGYTLTDSMKEIWQSGGEGYSVIAQYGNNFNMQLTTVNQSLAAIASHVERMSAQSDGIATTIVDNTAPTTDPTPAPSPTPKPTPEPAPKPIEQKPALTDKDYYGVALAICNGNYGWGSGATRTANLKAKGFDPNKMQTIVNKLFSDGYINSGAWVGKYYGISNLAPYHINKYLHGGLVDYTGLAQVDGTPGKPEIVLNAEDSANFITLRDAMRKLEDKDGIVEAIFGGEVGEDIVRKLMHIDSPANHNGSSIGDVHYEITIPIDHVQDYDDFMNKMRSDGKFEKFIQSMTIDRLAGASRLSKNKYQW